ncbi:MAG: sensor histidine kinase [Ruminiclostridium sp.]
MFKFKNTIFKKLVSIFIGLLILSYIVTGGFLYYFLNDYGTEQKKETLERSAKVIKSAFDIYYENMDSNYINQMFQNTLQYYSMSSNSMIWIVDKTGHIYFCESNLTDNSMLSKYIDETGLPKLPDPKQYNDVMDGEGYTIDKTGDFFGFFKDDAFKVQGSSWLTVQMPFQIIPSNGKQITIAAVYLHTPIPEVQKLQSSVFRLFMISGGVAIFLAIILVYIFSLRFTKPLKQINNAAKIIAGGEFRNRLVVDTKDEIGQLADSFNQMVDDLQKLEEMRRGFIANVSHELRTPMTSIGGFVEGILDGTIPPDRQKNYLLIVKDETTRLNRLVNDLLDLAKMESGELTLNIKPFNINELIRICVIKLETLITSKNLEIEANFEIDNLLVAADRDSIERVIINLLHNAVKFSNENGKIILETAKTKEKVLISIKDSGIGIDENEKKRVWDRFYKSDKSRGKDKTGTGLGLAIVKNIVNEHKQDIWVESEIGSGTKFTFTLDYFKSNNED